MTLPDGWVETTFADVVTVNPKHDRDTDREQIVSFVPMPAVDEHLGAIVEPVDRILDEIWTGFTHFAEGDVIFAKITPCMENGKAAVARGLTNGLACGSTEFYVLRPETDIQADYLWRYLRQHSYRSDAEQRMTGAVGQRRVPRQYLEHSPLPLPPAAEQRRIVEKLDALTARLGRAREELDRVPVLAANLRAAAVTESFRGTATAEYRAQSTDRAADDAHLASKYEAAAGRARRKPAVSIDWHPDIAIPSSWRWVSVDQVIARAQYGSSAKTSEEPGVAVLRMGNIQDGRIDFTKLKYLPDDHAEFPELYLQPGDVIFNRTNSFELVGKSAVFGGADTPVSFASYLIRVQCCAVRPKLLAYYLNSAVGRQWVAAVASQQVGQANVNGTKLRGLGIPLPPDAEQAEMEAWIDNAFARADRMEAEAACARALIDRLEAEILGRAFRGELVPQDPNDEPASALLDRIRAERAAAPRQKRGRRAKAG